MDNAAMNENPLPVIPLIDLRAGGMVRHVAENIPLARALRDECLSVFPRMAAPLLPVLDALARRWLMRSHSPYLEDIEKIAAVLGFPGVWLLNGSYQWGCTAMARMENHVPWLARTLDWPFPGLGRHVTIVLSKGEAGDFYSVTWPGYVGSLTAMAPGRFAASINQAPMYRRTLHPYLRPYDLAANAFRTWTLQHMPPDQLLRQVFESCDSFAAARAMLEETPIARPAIYTLAGCGDGDTCIIERTERDFATRCENVACANDWSESQAGWEGRIGASRILTSSYGEARESSLARRDTLVNFDGRFGAGDFDWLIEPVLNRYTRVAVEMCPAKSILRVVGYDVAANRILPHVVTQIREVNESSARAA